MSVVVVAARSLVVRWRLTGFSKAKGRGGKRGAHIGNDLDGNLGRLFGRKGRRFVGLEGIAAEFLEAFRIVGGLLASGSPPLWSLRLVLVRAIGRRQGAERCCGRRVEGRVGPVARHGGFAGRGELARGAGVGGGDAVVDGVVGGGLAVVVALLSLSRVSIFARRRVDLVRVSGCQGLRRRAWLGRVVNDDDFVGQAILVELVPVGALAFPLAARGGGGGGHGVFGLGVGSAGNVVVVVGDERCECRGFLHLERVPGACRRGPVEPRVTRR